MKENKAIVIVRNCRNELLKTANSTIFQAIAETQNTMFQSWLLDALELKYGEIVRAWMFSEETKPFSDLVDAIEKFDAKQKAKEEPKAEPKATKKETKTAKAEPKATKKETKTAKAEPKTAKTKAEPKQSQKTAKAEPKTTKTTKAETKSKKAVKEPKKAVKEPKKEQKPLSVMERVKKEISERFSAKDIKNNNAEIIAIAYALKESIADAKKTAKKQYYSKFNGIQKTDFNFAYNLLNEL